MADHQGNHLSLDHQYGHVLLWFGSWWIAKCSTKKRRVVAKPRGRGRMPVFFYSLTQMIVRSRRT